MKSLRGVWTVGVALAAAAGVGVIGIGVIYVTVDAGSLPQALGRVRGSTHHLTERGLFGVMVGGLLLLVAISLKQFQPGGALSFAGAGATGESQAANPPADAGRPADAEEYIELMDTNVDADRIMDREARRREERRAVEEAGGGESEGFEQAEAALIEHASHGDEHRPSKIMQDAVGPNEEPVDAVSGEADAEHLPD